MTAAPPSAFESAAKAVVFISAALALAAELRLAAGVVRDLPLYGAGAFMIAFTVARLGPRAVLGPLFATCYVTPALLSIAFGHYITQYYAIWLAALLGVIAGTTIWTRWHLPPAVRLPLATWALALAVTWPIVVAREYNFTWDVSGWRTNNSIGGIPPFFAALGICHAAATQLLTLLSIDWIVGRYGEDGGRRFAREVVCWLAVSAAISGAVGIYQSTVDIQFLNGGVFPSVGRTGGTMADANPYGTLTALWGPAAVALLLSLRAHAGAASTVAVLGASWFAFWPSGSRNALVAGMAGLIVVVVAQWPQWTRRSKLVLAFAGLAAVVGFAVFARSTAPTVMSPTTRFKQLIDRPAEPGASNSLIAKIWDPYGYAAVTRRMIADVPLVGLGVGTYSFLVLDYSRWMGKTTIAADNAQNWFRHQFAEMGLLGSVGWMAWTGAFAALIIAGKVRSADHRPAKRIVRSLPVIFTLVSLVGMPTMNPAAAVTFAVFAGWYLLSVDVSVLEPVRLFADRRVAWVAAWMIVAAFGAGTIAAARTDLRVPDRALRFGWPYAFGFYEPPTGTTRVPQRTAQRAVTVLHTAGRYLKLTFWAEHPDVGTRPVDVRIWRRTELLPKVSLVNHTPVIWYVQTPSDRDWMMLEFEASRTWWSEAPDRRAAAEIGLTLGEWTFVDQLPRGAAVVD